MHTPLICLVLFALWTVGLVALVLGPIRITKVLTRQAPPNAFPPEVPHGSPFYRRLMRAHANCVENLPVFGAVVLAATVVGYTPPILGNLAMVYLAGRIAQTTTHLISASNMAINIRFTFFLVQLVCLIWMGGLVLGHLFAA